MKTTKSILLFALCAVTVFSSVTPLLVEQASQVSINSSQIEEPREPWLLNTHHKRMKLEIDSNGWLRRAGEPIIYDFPEIVGLEPNSIRVFYKGDEIPSDYSPSTRKLTVVLPEGFDPENTKRYFDIYYDIYANGVKPQPDYKPDWVRDYILDYALNEDELEDNATSEWREFLSENEISEVDGHYYYHEQEVYYDEVTDTFYYENGSVIQSYAYYRYYYGEWEVYESADIWYYVTNDSAVEEPINLEFAYAKGMLYNDSMLVGYLQYFPYNGTWFLFDETDQLVGTLYDQIDHNVLVDYDYNAYGMGVIHTNSDVENYEVANTYATGEGSLSLSDGITTITETASSTIYRGSPVIKTQIVSDAPINENAWGSALIDLEGQIFFNNSWYDRHSWEELVDNSGLDSSEFSIAMNGGSRIKVYTEAGDLSFENLDWVNDGYLMGSSSIDVYDRGLNHVYQFPYLSGTTEYALDTQVLEIISVVGSISGDLAFTITQTEPFDTITILSAVDSEIITVESRSKKYKGDDELRVIPFLISSKYIALYDFILRKGFGFAYTETNAITNYLIEAWREVVDGVVNYYANISVNYNYFWFDPQGYVGDLHDEFTGAITMLHTFLEGNDIDGIFDLMSDLIDDALGLKPPMLKVAKNQQNAIPVVVRVLNTVRKFIRKGSSYIVDFIVEISGETLEGAYYQFVGETQRYAIENLPSATLFSDQPSIVHAGVLVNHSLEINNTGTFEILFIGVDTNGTSIVEAFVFSISVDTVDLAIFISCLGVGIGVIGMVGLYRARIGSKRVKGMPKSPAIRKSSMKSFKL